MMTRGNRGALVIGASIGLLGIAVAAASHSLGAGFLLMVLVLLYALPALVAYTRKVNNVGQIALLNLLAGWTFIGWIVALVWAAKPQA